MTEAVSRYSTAKGYFQAALMIYRSEDRQGREVLVLLPMCMLAGFALELYFKAWLLASGHGSGEVRG